MSPVRVKTFSSFEHLLFQLSVTLGGYVINSIFYPMIPYCMEIEQTLTKSFQYEIFDREVFEFESLEKRER